MPSLGFKIQTFVSFNEIKNTHKKCYKIIHACSNKAKDIVYVLFDPHRKMRTHIVKGKFVQKLPCRWHFLILQTFINLIFFFIKIGNGVEESFERIGERLMDVFNTPLIIESQYNDTIEITQFQSSKRSCCQKWAFH